MFRNDFPDLDFLKNMIGDIDAGVNTVGWPNVVINTRTSLTHRPDIKGTLSIFSNISGASYCMVAGRKVKIGDDMFFVSNKNQEYTLDIDETEATETFNIHFSTHMLDEYLGSIQQTDDNLLSNIKTGISGTGFYNKLYPKSAGFNEIIHTLYNKGNSGELTDMMMEELLAGLLQDLLSTDRSLQKRIHAIGNVKASTRSEIYKRLSMATDHIHSYYGKNMSLDELATQACMSKFHFLRLFKEIFGLTPYQYMASVRLNKAASLLRQTPLTATEISWMVGYDDPTSFNRAFYRFHKYRPQAYRDLIK